jgi:hypothetical protein
MIAEYDGICLCGCEERIIAGQTEIEYASGDGWVKKGHPKLIEVCDRCFMAKSTTGECACD